MRNNTKWIAAALLMGSLAAEAQENQILVKEKQVGRLDSQLVVGLTFDLHAVELASNRSLICTPLLTRGDSVKALPPLVVNGRNRQILYERGLRGEAKHTAPQAVRRRNGTEQTVAYETRIPFRRWMERAEVSLVIDECGCGWENLQESRSPLFTLNLAEPVVLRPVTVYLTPEAEAVKARKAEGRAYLDFPVNQTAIDANYRNNPSELGKIRQTIETVRGNRFATITSLTVKGYASPEGSYAANARLAEGRAKALLDYVQGLYDFGTAATHVSSVPEDWEGLERAVEAGSLPDRDALLAIIRADEPADFDAREWKLKLLNGGTSYKQLLRDVYPSLRHSDYEVGYTVRSFSVEEARELIFTDPSQLSLDEMFRVAQTYEVGSPQYNEVFEVAVRIYPDDPVSNLNAAVTAINAKLFDKARHYLRRAADTPERQLAEAALQIHGGKLAEARTLLEPLTDTRVAEAARENLRQIEEAEEANK